MKKITKVILVFLCLTSIVFSFASCGKSKSTKEKIIGNWESETTNNWMWLSISENGKCSMYIMDKSTAKAEMEEGTWTLDGENLTCDFPSLEFEFTYEDGKLIWYGLFEFTKMAKKPNVK